MKAHILRTVPMNQAIKQKLLSLHRSATQTASKKKENEELIVEMADIPDDGPKDHNLRAAEELLNINKRKLNMRRRKRLKALTRLSDDGKEKEAPQEKEAPEPVLTRKFTYSYDINTDNPDPETVAPGLSPNMTNAGTP